MLAAGLPLVVAAGLLGALGSHQAASAGSSQVCILGLICLGGSSSSSPTPSPTPTYTLPTCLPTALPSTLPTPLASLPADVIKQLRALPLCAASAASAAVGSAASAVAGALPSALPALPTALPTALPALPTALPALPTAIPGLPDASGATPTASPTSGSLTAAAAKGDLLVPSATSVISADTATMVHLSYQGNVTLHTASGAAVTLMKFTADSVTLTGHAAVTITEDGSTAVTSSPELAFDGNVVIYSAKLTGTLHEGALAVPLTLTPQSITTTLLPVPASTQLLHVANVLTANTTTTFTGLATDQTTGTASTLTFGPGGQGFSLTV